MYQLSAKMENVRHVSSRFCDSGAHCRFWGQLSILGPTIDSGFYSLRNKNHVKYARKVNTVDIAYTVFLFLSTKEDVKCILMRRRDWRVNPVYVSLRGGGGGSACRWGIRPSQYTPVVHTKQLVK